MRLRLRVWEGKVKPLRFRIPCLIPEEAFGFRGLGLRI